MPDLNDCLRLIAITKGSVEDIDSAYASRARLKRSVLSVGQLAAARVGVSEPLMPEDITRMQSEDPIASEILQICTSVLSKSRSLFQPSESLDSRWRTGWNAVCEDLELLEQVLTDNQDRLNN